MAEPDTYRTIKQRSEGVFRDRGSKFLAFAFPVNTRDEIKKTLAELRKEYHDARHHCYAYRLGAAKEIFRANDDGEPSGTAGKPILGQIRSNDLSNILIVVVRYFGGTLLGVGGLINAYRTAAANAIHDAIIITAAEQDLIEISFPYVIMNKIMKIIRDEEMKILEQDFTETCKIKAFIRKSRTTQVLNRLSFTEEISARKL
ncbi:MAG: YigZ family protein [Bacteroidales bacterium]|nr:YigZ family protein [Bacteroidales bacterium]